MGFAEDKARVDRAAATMYHRHEYIAAELLIAARWPSLHIPDWRDLSRDQQDSIMRVLDQARQAGLSCRSDLSRLLTGRP